jgi:hypothetical protein
MDLSEAKVSPGRATMTTGQAAKRLGMTTAMVRRRLQSGALEGYFTDPDSGRTDTNGNPMRGHRRVFVDSVEAYEVKLRGEANPPERNS